jgi:hypothetical protein
VKHRFAACPQGPGGIKIPRPEPNLKRVIIASAA